MGYRNFLQSNKNSDLYKAGSTVPIWRYIYILLDLNVFNVSFSELTSGKEVETFIEQQHLF